MLPPLPPLLPLLLPPLLLPPSGTTAVCRALFSKLLFLTEHEPLVAQGSEAFKVADLRTVSS